MSGISSFGDLLLQYRRASGLSQAELAERAGMSARAISDLERGFRRRPRASTARLLADALDISPAERALLLRSARRPSSQTPSPPVPSPRSLPTGGFLGALPVGLLVAREAELAQMLAAVDAVEQGEGRLTLVAGEAGVGKTRLMQEIALTLQERDFLVLLGRCYQPEREVAYYPVLEPLGAAWDAAPDAVRAHVLSQWPSLKRLLPGGDGSAGSGVSESSPAEPHHLARSVGALLRALAAHVPVALFFDDLHWADSATLMLLQHLARLTHSARVLLLGTFRDAEVDPHHPLRTTIVELGRERLVNIVKLPPLSRAGTRALIEALLSGVRVSDASVDLIFERTDGNPFFILEVLHELSGAIQREGGVSQLVVEAIDVPDSLRTLILHRVALLTPRTQETLYRASVWGQVFLFDDLRATGEESEADLERDIEEARQAGLVRAVGKDSYAFNHALTYQAIYDALPAHRLRRLHLAAGQVMETLPERVRPRRAAQLARHFQEGGDTERALRYTLAAGEQAADVFAHTEAEQCYRTALRLAEERNDDGQIGEALYQLGRQLMLAPGRYAEALPLLEEAAQRFQATGNLIRACNAVGVLAQVCAHQGRGDERLAALARLQRLLESAQASGIPPTRNLAHLYTRLADTHIHVEGAIDKALVAADRAAELARALGDVSLRTRAEVGRATALATKGQIRDAIRVADGIIPRAERTGDLTLLELALGTAAEFLMWNGQLERSRGYGERALAIAERRGISDTLPWTMSNLAQIAIYQGDWHVARTHAETALEMARATGSALRALDPLLRLGEVTARQGQWKEAAHYLEDCVARASNLGAWQILLQAQRAMADRDLRSGDPTAARARLAPLITAYDPHTIYVAHLVPLLAWAYLELGETTEAARLAAESRERAEANENRLTLVDTLRVQGMIQARQGRREEARRILEGAAALARTLPYSFAEAQALHLAGMSHAEDGNHSTAQIQLLEALAIFRRLGATNDAEQTERALREGKQA